MQLWQPPLPERYNEMSDDELIAAIEQRKRELVGRCVILGHHYQQDDVIRFADFTGDSFKLSQLAAEEVEKTGATNVVFAACTSWPSRPTSSRPRTCGHPAGPRRRLLDGRHGRLRPDRRRLGADRRGAPTGENVRVIPVCYMNSSAAIKAFVGEHGGAVCTSPTAIKRLRMGPGRRRHATRPRARDQDPVPARSAPRAEHRRVDGLRRRHRTCACGTPSTATAWAGGRGNDRAQRPSFSGRATARCTSSSAPSTSTRSARVA